MPIGALDPNGVWLFGEDDERDTFSELLNIGQDATSDAIGADRARLATLEADGALGALMSGVATAVSGWSITTANGRKKNGIAYIYLRIVRTGAGIPGGADGNIANTQMATLAAGWVNASIGGYYPLSHAGPAGPIYAGYIGGSGTLNLSVVAPGSSVVTGDTYDLAGSYPLA